jgi:hypothetical protein
LLAKDPSPGRQPYSSSIFTPSPDKSINSGTLANGKEIYIALQWDTGADESIDTAVANSYWRLGTGTKFALGTIMERTTVMLRNDTQGPVNDVHLVLGDGKLVSPGKVYKVFSVVDSPDKVAWTCSTTLPANAIDCSRTGTLEYKGLLIIDWKVDIGAAIASGYWTESTTNRGPITIIRMDP